MYSVKKKKKVVSVKEWWCSAKANMVAEHICASQKNERMLLKFQAKRK